MVAARGGARLIQACQTVDQAYAVSRLWVSEGARARGADGSPPRGGSGDAGVALDPSEGSRAVRRAGRGAPSSCGAWSNWGVASSPPRAERAPSSTASSLKEVVFSPDDLSAQAAIASKPDNRRRPAVRISRGGMQRSPSRASTWQTTVCDAAVCGPAGVRGSRSMCVAGLAADQRAHCRERVRGWGETIAGPAHLQL
jgi:hypothetical protein